MPISAWFALAAYLLTLIASIALAKRSTNWRIRLLAYTITLLPLCRGVVVLSKNQIWSQEVNEVAEMLELLIAALCLTAIYLLDKENRDRKNADVRLRLNEVIQSSRRLLGPQNGEGTLNWATERRKEPRLSVDMAVTVTVLGGHAPPEIPGRVRDLSGNGLCVVQGAPIALGSLVKVEGGGILVLGEVVRCDGANGEYGLGLEVSEWLSLAAAAELYGAKGNSNTKGLTAHVFRA